MNCDLCPRGCSVDRYSNEIGYCGAGNRIKIARNALHYWEEPPISGTRGSGAVFFTYCNLHCVFCQNYEISKNHVGRYIDINELSDIFIDLQNQGAHNINLVTPTHYSDLLIKALEMAKINGLKIPVVYNCGGYESVEALKRLDGLVDIYLPDMKYYNDKYAIRYSKAKEYFKYCSMAISEMFKQTGKNIFDSKGIMQKGVIVRHLMLPGLLFDSKKIIDYLYKTYGDDIYISIMRQYTPMPHLEGFEELNRTIIQKYYDSLIEYASELGIKNAFVQSGEAIGESFIPFFSD